MSFFDNERRQYKNGDEIPFGDSFEKGIMQFNKKAAGALASAFLRSLTNATEIFFRKDLGERFFTGAYSGGIIFWGASAMGSFFFGGFVGGRIPAVIISLVLAGAFFYFATENARRLQQFREDGRTYHSMSRGVPRWGNPETNLLVGVGAFAALCVFAPVTAALFLVSRYLSAQEAAKQQAAMYDRYLDALDAKIEAEFLNDALLGKCAPEITYLYKPLPATMKPELRENIAAAATGKPVKIIGQAPKPTEVQAA